MPRRESSYTPDDEDDDIRRGGASGGGLPAWVWVVGGSGVLAVVVFAGLAFALFSTRRAEVAHMQAERARGDLMMKAEIPARGMRPGAVEVVELKQIAEAYRTDPDEAESRFQGRRLQLWIEVRKAEDEWVGAVASIGKGLPLGRVPNVYFMTPNATVADGAEVLIEGTCSGLSPDPVTGVRLTFTDCRIVEE